MPDLPMQYVGIVFSPLGRTYTYHHQPTYDADQIRVGDKVRVDGREGSAAVQVVSVTTTKPHYATKPIAGRVPPPEVA